ncbi:MAG: hypothetical protein IK025_04040, partial [Bacteroidales bacterium]|nr:hypothetical protein [Bacteroidales bacterium]
RYAVSMASPFLRLKPFLRYAVSMASPFLRLKPFLRYAVSMASPFQAKAVSKLRCFNGFAVSEFMIAIAS